MMIQQGALRPAKALLKIRKIIYLAVQEIMALSPPN